MVIEKQISEDTTTIYLQGRLDAETAPAVQEYLDELEKTAYLIFDIKLLEYVSSAGLRLFLTMQKRQNMQQAKMLICNASRDLMDIFDVTGFSDILTIEKKLREVSIQGCKLIGQGCCGECYKLDEETVLKLYFEGTDRQVIEWEKKYAKEAFKLGIPTAISYDMVVCQNRLGVAYEMLHAKTLSEIISSDLKHMEQYATEFANLARLVHSTIAPKDAFPDFTIQLEMFLEQNIWMTTEQHDRYLEVLHSLPKKQTCIHGDFHTSNVMVQNGELLFIDMGDFSAGNPMFDIAHIYNMFGMEEHDEMSKAITKLDMPDRKKFWRYFLKAYNGLENDYEIKSYEEDLLPYVALKQVKYIPFFESTAADNTKVLLQGIAESNRIKNIFTLEACDENLNKVISFINSLLEEHQCSIKEQTQVDVAVEEIFVNIAHYAYPGKTGEVTVQYELQKDNGQLLIWFMDKGIPYNPLKRLDPDITVSAEDRQVGGLGIFLVKKMMNDLHYRYFEGENILLLMKQLNA